MFLELPASSAWILFSCHWFSAADCHLHLFVKFQEVPQFITICGTVAELLPFVYFRRYAIMIVILATRSAPIKVTRRGLAAQAFTLEVNRVRTSQFSRSLVPACVRCWSSLGRSIFDSGEFGQFKFLINRILLQSWSLLFFLLFLFFIFRMSDRMGAFKLYRWCFLHLILIKICQICIFWKQEYI